jgi:hypothetical protein
MRKYMKMKTNPMTPEAKTPEARATEAAARAMCDRVNGVGAYDANIGRRQTVWVTQAQAGIEAYLAASTARPTERGAVEDAIAGAREFVDAADAEGFDAADALDMIREFAALPATDQPTKDKP